MSDDEIYFGVGERNALFYEYWNFRADRMREILNQLDAESELAQQFNQRLKRIGCVFKKLPLKEFFLNYFAHINGFWLLPSTQSITWFTK